MEEKTKDKIMKVLENLPKHHIDTSILLESENTEDGIFCRRYLQRVGYNYRGIISFPVLSELLSAILILKTYNERQTGLEIVNEILKTRNINLYCPENIENISMKIKEIDTRINGLDRHILACAIEDRSNNLITLDKKLLNNEKLENYFNIKIRHPKDYL